LFKEGKAAGNEKGAAPARMWLEEITNTWAFDVLMRVIYVSWFLFVLYGVVRGLRDYFESHGSVTDAMFISTVVARMAVIVFFATLISFVVIRLRPVRKSQGSMPRLAAFLGTFILMSLSQFPANDMSLTGNIMSAMLVFAGSGLCIYVVFWLGRSLSIMPEARRLVTGGPYALVRHPLYAAEEISILGTYLLYASWWTTALLILHAYLQIKRMGYEEEVLCHAFPDYDDYARRTARLIPGIY
jgi:protein-S-isoprenylcysteine O-methyltransferase Ste14